MPRILTLTLNPALDVSTAIDRVEPVHKMRCGEPAQHPGGGGINVARVLHRLRRMHRRTCRPGACAGCERG